MTPFIDLLLFTVFFVIAMLLMGFGLTTIAERFVQDLIARHERRHHRNDSTTTTSSTERK